MQALRKLREFPPLNVQSSMGKESRVDKQLHKNFADNIKGEKHRYETIGAKV